MLNIIYLNKLKSLEASSSSPFHRCSSSRFFRGRDSLSFFACNPFASTLSSSPPGPYPRSFANTLLRPKTRLNTGPNFIHYLCLPVAPKHELFRGVVWFLGRGEDYVGVEDRFAEKSSTPIPPRMARGLQRVPRSPTFSSLANELAVIILFEGVDVFLTDE